jgi:hypothetical protein
MPSRSSRRPGLARRQDPQLDQHGRNSTLHHPSVGFFSRRTVSRSRSRVSCSVATFRPASEVLRPFHSPKNIAKVQKIQQALVQYIANNSPLRDALAATSEKDLHVIATEPRRREWSALIYVYAVSSPVSLQHRPPMKIDSHRCSGLRHDVADFPTGGSEQTSHGVPAAGAREQVAPRTSRSSISRRLAGRPSFSSGAVVVVSWTSAGMGSGPGEYAFVSACGVSIWPSSPTLTDLGSDHRRDIRSSSISSG